MRPFPHYSPILSITLLLSLLFSAPAGAAISTFDSPLGVPATLNTTENLNYQGTNTMVPPSTENPSGVVHTSHFGADTALWNTAVAGGSASAPATGQVSQVRLEGCAQQPAGAPTPLTEIHFQTLHPNGDGSVTVTLTSQAFGIPICGQSGAGSTVSTYEPVNLCVDAGDYVAFNDEGGYEPTYYRSGVPYQVIGSVPGSSMNSFIMGNGTGNGSVFSPSNTNPMQGFATNANEELLLQATLATGEDATPACGGTKGVVAPGPVLPTIPLRLKAQTDGVNAHRVVSVAIYCNLAPGCAGSLTLKSANGKTVLGSAKFKVKGKTTSHTPIRLSKKTLKLVRKSRRGLKVLANADVASFTVSRLITVKIF